MTFARSERDRHPILFFLALLDLRNAFLACLFSGIEIWSHLKVGSQKPMTMTLEKEKSELTELLHYTEDHQGGVGTYPG